MKKTNWLILAAASVAALLLRLWQNASGFESTGLAVPGTAPALLLPALLAVTAVYFVFDARRLPRRGEHGADLAESFVFSRTTALPAAVSGGLLVLLSGGAQLMGRGSLKGAFLAVPALLGGLCALYLVMALYRGAAVNEFLPLVPVCALLVYVVFLYRADAADPVLQRIYPEILASAALTLSWLERAAFAYRCGAPRLYLPLNQLALLLSLLAAADLRSPAAALLGAGCALGELAFLLAFRLPETNG